MAADKTDDARGASRLHAELGADARREIGKWLNEEIQKPIDRVALAELCADYDRLRADAERYRWLRGGNDVPPHSLRWPRWEVRNWDGRWWQTIFAEQLDEAIDAAMQRDQVPN